MMRSILYLLVSLWSYLLYPCFLSGSLALPTEYLQHNGYTSLSFASSPSTALTTHPSPGVKTRRALQNMMGGFKTEDVGDGWIAQYQPLEALMPSQRSASDLVQFYSQLMNDLMDMLENGMQPIQDMEIAEGDIALRLQSNVQIPWSVTIEFLSWIVSPMCSYFPGYRGCERGLMRLGSLPKQGMVGRAAIE